jgi:transposase-like protein
LAQKYDLHPNQVSAWKKLAKEDLVEVFGLRSKRMNQKL